MKRSHSVFLFLMATIFSMPLLAQNSLCVLGFERRDLPVSLGLKKVFDPYPTVHLVIEATPQDLLYCLKRGYGEIIFVAHALLMDKDGEKVNLAYFKEKLGAERKEFIDTSMSEMQDRIDTLVLRQDPSRDLDIEKLQASLEKMKNFPEKSPIYGAPFVIFNRFFETIETEITRMTKSRTLQLKKFRLMTCESDKTLERYPFFHDLKTFGIELDVAPVSKLGSLLTGKQVTNFNFGWIKKSLGP